jgi:hypothetical protein
MPEDYEPPELKAIQWHSPEWGVLEEEGEELARLRRLGMDGVEFPFCEEVRKDIRKMRHRKVAERVERGHQWNPDPLEGHHIVLRKKVAVGLCLLHNSTEVSEQAWKLAGQFMEMSNHTRSQVQEVLSDVGFKTKKRRGRDRAVERVAEREETERLYEEKRKEDIKKAAAQIRARMDDRNIDRIPESTLRALLSDSLKPFFEEAITLLRYRTQPGKRKGQVVVRDRPLRSRGGGRLT